MLSANTRYSLAKRQRIQQEAKPVITNLNSIWVVQSLFMFLIQMMPVLQPEEEEASGSSVGGSSPAVSTPSPSRSKVSGLMTVAERLPLYYLKPIMYNYPLKGR